MSVVRCVQGLARAPAERNVYRKNLPNRSLVGAVFNCAGAVTNRTYRVGLNAVRLQTAPTGGEVDLNIYLT